MKGIRLANAIAAWEWWCKPIYMLAFAQNDSIHIRNCCNQTQFLLTFLLYLLYFHDILYTKAVVQSCSVNKLFLEISQNSQENTCARVSGLRPATLLKMGLLMRVFSCEFCEISKNTFLHKTPLMAASVYSSLYGRLYVNHAQNQHFWSFLIIYKGHCSSEILWQNLVSKQLWHNYWKRKFEKLCTIRRE